MGEKKVVEEWFLVSSLDGGYNRFPFRSLLGLSEYIKKEKEDNPSIKTRVIIAGGVLGFLPPYVTKGYLNDVKALREEKKIKVNVNALNDMVVATKPHLMRIVENVDEVYYIAGIEDNKNINELYTTFYNSFRYRSNVQNLWGELCRFFEHEEKVKTIIEQTKFSEEINKKRLEELNKEIEKEKLTLEEINELTDLIKKKPIEDKELEKEWKEKLEKQRKRIWEKERYEKELLNIHKKLKLNESELEDCKNIQKLLKEVLLKRYVEYIEPIGLKDIPKAVEEIQKELNYILEKYDGEVPPEIFEKLKEVKEEILKRVEEIKNEKINYYEKKSDLEEQYELISKERQQVEEEINKLKKQKEYLEKNNEKVDEIEKLIEELKEKSNSLQKELKRLAKEMKKFSYSKKMYQKTTSFEGSVGFVRGSSDDAKLILKLALAEYLFYLRNVLGRRENVKIILNGKENNDRFDLLFQNNMTIGEKEIKVATNLNRYGRYTQNSMRIAVINTKNEDFVFFLNSAPCYKLVPSDNKKGYSFVIGVPPLVDFEKLEEERSLGIETKYSLPLLKGLLLPSIVALRFYENERVGLAVLKEPFLHKISNDRIEKEKKSLRTRKIEKETATIKEDSKDTTEILNISQKLPSELSSRELSLLLSLSQNLEEVLLKKYYNPKIKGELCEVRYYIIADAHVGAASVIDLTKPSSEELLLEAGKIVSKDMKSSGAQTKVLGFGGDMIEALEYGITESQIPELLGEFERWLESKKISEETKEKAILYFSFLIQKRMEHLKYGPIGNIVKPFSEAIVDANKVVIISGNHQPKNFETKKTTEADLIYEYAINNTGVEPIKMIKAPGEEFGGIELKVNFGGKEENVLFVHKYYLHNVSRNPSKRVFSAHFHEFLSVFTTNGWLIQTGALASTTAYVFQQGIPHSEQLRGFSEVKVSYVGGEEAIVEIQPVLVEEITRTSKVREVGEKAFGKEEHKEIMQLIKEFIAEKEGVVVEKETKEKETKKKEEPKGLLRFIGKKEFEIREEGKRKEFQVGLREESKSKAKDKKITDFF